jgi:hypothetical protein
LRRPCLIAFTVSDDHRQQEKVWAERRKWGDAASVPAGSLRPIGPNSSPRGTRTESSPVFATNTAIRKQHIRNALWLAQIGDPARYLARGEIDHA